MIQAAVAFVIASVLIFVSIAVGFVIDCFSRMPPMSVAYALKNTADSLIAWAWFSRKLFADNWKD